MNRPGLSQDQAAIRTLARRILAIEARKNDAAQAMEDPEWFELIVTLWNKLEGSGDTRQSRRLTTGDLIQLDLAGQKLEAEVRNVSHSGLQVAGNLEPLRPEENLLCVAVRSGQQQFLLQAPCRVMWRTQGEDGVTLAGLSLIENEGPPGWRQRYLRWYVHVYRCFLQELARDGGRTA
jgi:hypothetical protein